MPRHTDNTWLERIAGYLQTMSSGGSSANKIVANGRKVVATAGTAEVLAPAATYARSVSIVAELDNTGVITVGGPGVVGALATRQGVPLNAGDSMSADDIDDLSDIWLDTTVNGDGVTYTYTR